MKTFTAPRAGERGVALVAYLVVALVITAAIAGIAGYVVQNIQFNQRRQSMVNAIQYAQAGAAMACLDVNIAFTNASGTFLSNLTGGSPAYTKNNGLSVNNQWVYERTITSPFTNQTVTVQLWMTNSTSPSAVKILATASVGKSTQTSQINLEMRFGAAGAIISTDQGNTSNGISKSTAQGGNVVVDGGSTGTTRIDGGIVANGNAVTNKCVVDSMSKSLYGTSSQIPDYTNPGSSNQLFDFNRFIAAADVMGTHYTNATTFMNIAKLGTIMEGIIVVDVPKSGTQPVLDDSKLPYGINVRGTLIFNFTGNWAPLDKIVNTATMNINPANLSGLVASNPSTYTTGYPPTYTNASRNPINVDITAKGFNNFTVDDDLPALMYNNAILDIHGDANICGAVYSSSFMEIENKNAGQVQYFRGALIGGGGIYVENGQTATSIVSYDAKAISNLATSGNRGKTLSAVYRK